MPVLSLELAHHGTNIPGTSEKYVKKKKIKSLD